MSEGDQGKVLKKAQAERDNELQLLKCLFPIRHLNIMNFRHHFASVKEKQFWNISNMKVIVQEFKQRRRLILKELSTNDIYSSFWLFKPLLTLAWELVKPGI